LANVIFSTLEAVQRIEACISVIGLKRAATAPGGEYLMSNHKRSTLSDRRSEKMSADISVVVPVHNPRQDYLERVLGALRSQRLPLERWELLVVDNRSDSPVASWLDLSWHRHAAVVREEDLGLTRARVRGLKETGGRIVVFVDDDNVLAPDYLEEALAISGEFPFLGTWGGGIAPEFECPKAAPPRELHALLTLREVSDDLWSNDPGHHASTPWGAGLCVRREVAEAYVREIVANPARASLDLKGNTLVYSGDTDIAYTGCRMGFAKGVFSRLRVIHLIPAQRCTAAYLCRVAQGRGYSEVLHAYLLLGIIPARDKADARQVWRYISSLLKPGIQRSTAFAHLRGRRHAFRDLAASQLRR
jgi:glycosyltransferase involved in cell wall biosynthesis